MGSNVSRLRSAVLSGGAALLLATTTLTAAPTPVAAATPASTVISIAESHLGRPWVFGATGPYAFDCSGLVYSVFRQAGLLSVIGGGRMSASGYWSYFARRGQASPYNGQPGDLVIFGYGAHIGIYMGGGRVISTLVTGVGFSTLSNTIPRFTTFLHTHLYSGGVVYAAATTATRMTTVFLNFRTGPGTNYGIMAVLPPWLRVSVLGSARDVYGRIWDRIRLGNGATGWVASWYLR